MLHLISLDVAGAFIVQICRPSTFFASECYYIKVNMKKYLSIITGLCACLSLSGCGLMEVSFRAGFIAALILAAIVGLLIWVLHITWKLLGRYFPRIRYHLEEIWED